MATGKLTIDLDAIAANWRALDAMSLPHVETAAVVKADAYGLGVSKVAPALAKAGARSFFVAVAEEGAAVRQALGPDVPIYVFGGYMEGDAALCDGADLIPLLNSPDQVSRFLAELPGRVSGLQIDSGMNRLGLEPADLPQVMLSLPRLAPKLVMSHLAAADTPLSPINTTQLAAFTTMSAAFTGVPLSLAATGGTVMGAAYHFAMTRPGVGLYGGMPFAEAKPVVILSLPVIQVRNVLPGEIVGYGGAWSAKRLSKIATVSAGYADGILRAAGAGVRVFAGETPCPVVGRVSMDLITVDVTDLPAVPDALDILSPYQTVDDLAAAAGTIGYEILTSLGTRYQRHYTGG